MKKRVIAAVLVLALLFTGCCVLVDALSGHESQEEKNLVYNAIRSAAVTCYAIEGAYPMDLSYLRQNYGLQYDESRFLVVYDAFASNLMPDIRILDREVTNP